MISEIVPSALAGERLDRIVSFVADISRSDAAADDRRRRSAASTVRRAVSGKVRLVEGQLVEVDESTIPRVPLPVADPSVEFDVVYEDAAVIVVDKPAALVVHPGAGNTEGTLVQRAARPLSRHRRRRRADTGPGSSTAWTPAAPGCSWSPARRSRPTRSIAQFASHTTAANRRYVALVWGHPDAAHGIVDAPIGRDPARPAPHGRGCRRPPVAHRVLACRTVHGAGRAGAARLPARDRPHPPDPCPPRVDRSPARRRPDLRPAASVARSRASVPPRRRAGVRPPGDAASASSSAPSSPPTSPTCSPDSRRRLNCSNCLLRARGFV